MCVRSTRLTETSGAAVKIQIASDIHLEFGTRTLPAKINTTFFLPA